MQNEQKRGDIAMLSLDKLKLEFVIDGLAGPTRVIALDGREEISRPFLFDIRAVFAEPDGGVAWLIDRPARLTIKGPSGTRHFHGLIGHAERGATQSDGIEHHLSLVPSLWRLAHRQTSRIFQELTLPEVVTSVLNEAGLDGSFGFALDGSYDPEETLVQYQESDFDFVSRLTEEAGLYYAVAHQDGQHRIVFGDGELGRLPPPGGGTLVAPYRLGGGQAREEVTAFRQGDGLRSGKVALREFDFETPASYLDAEATGARFADLAHFSYPGRFESENEGQVLAARRLEGYVAEAQAHFGESTVLRLLPGSVFTLKGYPRRDSAGDYLVVRVVHRLRSKGAEEPLGYENSFACLPADLPFRPERSTPRPAAPGLQSATVVGQSGEEIHVDEFGRIKVQFHWDRLGTNDEHASAWLRVAQPWAGAGWGALFLPRVGQEVVVAFLHGDLRRPIVLGGLYNERNMPRFALPEHRTRSGFVSKSTPNGRGGNELIFEDKAGAEELILRAQKDLNLTVGNDSGVEIANDEHHGVGHHRSRTVGVSETIQVGADQSVTVGGAKTESVAGNRTETVGINASETVGAGMELTVGGAYKVTVGAMLTQQITGAQVENVGSNRTLTVGADLTHQIGGDMTQQAAGDWHLRVGRDADETVAKSYRLRARTVSIEAQDQLALKCGRAQIVLKKNGDIDIKGADISIKGSGNVTIKGRKVTTN